MSEADDMRTMKAQRRFTMVGEGLFDRDPPGLRGDPNGMWTTYSHLEERVAAERAACAELVRAAGCICFHLVAVEGGEDFDGEIDVQEDPAGIEGSLYAVERHDRRCPQALAAAIEARGEA